MIQFNLYADSVYWLRYRGINVSLFAIVAVVVMGKCHDLLEAARNGNIHVVGKILEQYAKRGPLSRWVSCCVWVQIRNCNYFIIILGEHKTDEKQQLESGKPVNPTLSYWLIKF